jgi:protein tyrosine/serine phosphatase
MTFENLFNFRDLGGPQTVDGGRVQPGRLYRSESVAYISAADAVRLVDEIGLATVVDLRGDREVERWGRGPLGERSLRYVHVPITDVTRGSGSMSSYYIDMLTRRADDVVGLLRRLLEPGALPAVVHCEAGCDRTGVVAATVLGLVGVPDDAIITDFDRTEPSLPAMNARWKASYLARGNPQQSWIDETWAEREEAMTETIAAMRERWGDWDGWAAAHGFSEDERRQLRKLLVE